RIQSVSGGGHWGGGIFISARDLARFGYLTLRQGRWKDRQLLSREWLAMAETPGTANEDYGYMNFFLNTSGTAIPAAPRSAFTHRGAGNNIIYVDRENDLVIVMRWVQGGAVNEFIERVLGAVGEEGGGAGAVGRLPLGAVCGCRACRTLVAYCIPCSLLS